MTIACYKPLVRCEELGKWIRAKDGHLYHPAKVFSSDNLEALDYFTHNTGYHNYELIPCGNCIGCRLDYSREWANRGYLEQTGYPIAYFITLTHDDENHFVPEEIITSDGFTFTEIEEIPWQGCLDPDEMTKFMHDYRQICKRKYNLDGIRFMLCGEYGTKGRREHYHLIIFQDKDLPMDTFYKPRVDWKKDTYWQNTIIEQAWGKGIVNVTIANWATIAYVARYITKKVKGKESELHYAIQGEVKEFFRTSRNHGIGYEYYQKHKKEIYENDRIWIQKEGGGQYVTPPKYYDKMYEAENPEHMKVIKANRKKRSVYNLKAKAMNTSLTAYEQLQVEMAYKEEKLLSLKRDLEI